MLAPLLYLNALFVCLFVLLQLSQAALLAEGRYRRVPSSRPRRSREGRRDATTRRQLGQRDSGAANAPTSGDDALYDDRSTCLTRSKHHHSQDHLRRAPLFSGPGAPASARPARATFCVGRLDCVDCAVAPAIARLPWTMGGYRVPDVRLALLTLAAMTILKWARSLQPSQQIVPAALLRPHIGHGRLVATSRVYIFPARTPTTTLRLGRDVWSTGLRIVQRAAAATQLDDRTDRDLFLFRLVTLASRPLALNWTTGGFLLRVPLIRHDTTWGLTSTTWCAEWIAHLPCGRQELWREWPTHPAAPMARLRRVLASGFTIGDVIIITWRSPGCVEFRRTARVSRHRDCRRAIEELGMRLVAAYPALLRCPPLPNELRPFPSTEATTELRWYLPRMETGAALCVYHWTGTAATRSAFFRGCRGASGPCSRARPASDGICAEPVNVAHFLPLPPLVSSYGAQRPELARCHHHERRGAGTPRAPLQLGRGRRSRYLGRARARTVAVQCSRLPSASAPRAKHLDAPATPRFWLLARLHGPRVRPRLR